MKNLIFSRRSHRFLSFTWVHWPFPNSLLTMFRSSCHPRREWECVWHEEGIVQRCGSEVCGATEAASLSRRCGLISIDSPSSPKVLSAQTKKNIWVEKQTTFDEPTSSVLLLNLSVSDVKSSDNESAICLYQILLKNTSQPNCSFPENYFCN